MNQIIEVKLTLLNEVWKIEVTKEFAPEYGGGSQVFVATGGHQIHNALRRAAEMVTLTPSYNNENQCPGCGAGLGWVQKNPALHEEQCGGVGKGVWERKGICEECGKLFRGGRYCDECTAKFDLSPHSLTNRVRILEDPDPPTSHDYDWMESQEENVMSDIKLNRNQYEALRSLLSELDDIEDFHSLTNPNRINVDGSLAKDNINELRILMDLEVKD